MRNHITLTFGTADGGRYTLRISDSLNTTNDMLYRGVMDEIIEANAFDTGERGDLVKRHSASLFRVTEQNFDVA